MNLVSDQDAKFALRWLRLYNAIQLYPRGGKFMKVLSEDEIEQKLGALHGWTLTPQGIQKRYEMGNFRSVMNLVNRVANLAEEINHHPDIFVNYDKVTFTLTTHDSGGITERDFKLAERIEAIAP